MRACKTCIGKLYVVHDSVNIEEIELKTDDVFEALSPVWKLDVCPLIGHNKVYNTRVVLIGVIQYFDTRISMAYILPDISS